MADMLAGRLHVADRRLALERVPVPVPVPEPGRGYVRLSAHLQQSLRGSEPARLATGAGDPVRLVLQR